MKILYVLADPLAPSKSVNRRVAGQFLTHLERDFGELSVVEVDLCRNPPPFLDIDLYRYVWGPFVDPGFNPSARERDAAAYMHRQVELFTRADLLLIAAPVWNYYLPASLKAWIDQIVSPGFVYEFGDSGPQPLHRVGSVVSIVSAGGQLSKYDTDKALFKLLHAPFRYIGIDRFHDVLIEAQEPALYPDHAEREAQAAARVERLAERLLAEQGSVSRE